MYEQIESNKRKSILLVVLFAVFLGILAFVLSYLFEFGIIGYAVAIIFIILFSVIGYYNSANIVLKISGARKLEKKEFPHLFHTVEGLAIAAGIPAPKCYVIEDTALNAFATGRNPETGVIVVTTGLLKKLNRLELEGVIAHEMSHIKNLDIRLMTITTVFVGIAILLSDFILRSFIFGRRNRDMGKAAIPLIVLGIALAVFTPFIAQAINLAISRKREFLADASGAMLTRYPEGLASALEKISSDKTPLKAANKATAHLYISNPLKNTKSFLSGMFSTHPPVQERVKALRSM
jgi:heat shock protein HtpX